MRCGILTENQGFCEVWVFYEFVNLMSGELRCQIPVAPQIALNLQNTKGIREEPWTECLFSVFGDKVS